MKPIRLLLLFLSFCPLPMYAQTAEVSGAVQDPSGAVIPKASVEYRNQETGIRRQTTTNNEGVYHIVGLDPGKYDATVQAKGFKTLTRANVTFQVADKAQIDFKMQVGDAGQTVTVDGSGLTLNTTDASVSTVVDQKFVANIPLNGRSFQDLISMTPGVVNQSPQYYETQLVGGGGDFSVNGQRTQSNYYTVDGVTANISSGNGGGVGESSTGGTLAASTALGTTQTLVPVDALQEFRIQSSSYSAEYGRSPGGQFSIVTRSGTNTIHGSVYDYLRNNYFDANDWFNDHYGDPTPALRQNDFGADLSGPVRFPRLYNGRDRTFFFVAYEGLRLVQPTAATIQYVPDTYMRQQAIPAMQPILNAFPLQNGMDYGSAANPNLAEFISAYSLPSSIDATSVRVDHSFSPKVSAFFRAGIAPSSTQSRPYFSLLTTAINAQTYTLGVDAGLGAHWNNQFRLGYARSDSSQLGVLDSFGGATPIDLAAAMGAGSYQQVMPTMDIYIPGIGSPLITTQNTSNAGRQWNLVDTLSALEGHHNLKIGIDFRHIRSLIGQPQLVPYAIFEQTSTVLSGIPDLPYIFAYRAATPIFHQLALFAQDEWRLRNDLTLSLGLRWEYSPPPTEAHGQDAFTLLGDLNDPSTLTVAPRGTSLWNASRYNFAPRLGVAWVANNHPGHETILRAGSGVFFDSANEVASDGFNGLGFEAQATVSGAQLPFTTSELNVPITVTPPYTSSVITAFPQHLQMPYTLEWNVGLQQAVGRDQAFTLSYVGAEGRRLLEQQYLYLNSFNSDFNEIQYFPNGITSNYQALQFQFQRSVSKGLEVLTSYTWSHAIDFGSQSTELVLQRGNSDFDVRNNFQAGFTWSLPAIHGEAWQKWIVNDWGIDSRLIARSAYPLTLGGNQQVNSVTGAYYDAGLDLVPGEPIYLRGSQYPGGKAVNPAAFSVPTTGINGDAPRNFVRGFGATQWNMALRRTFPIHDTMALSFRAETFNLSNRPNFGYVDATYSDATFGQATQMLNASLGTMASQYQQGGPRSMQFALRLSF
jgi:Carboxypeptidase regulatory-like domain/TonB dependent receptor